MSRGPIRAWVRFLAAAAGLVVACGAALWPVPARDAASWAVMRVTGNPVAGSTPVGKGARLPLGEWLETDASSKAVLEVSTIGQLTSSRARGSGSWKRGRARTASQWRMESCTP